MVRYAEYESLDEFDGRRRRTLEHLLFDDETFIYAIDCKDGRLSAATRKLVLTDRRIVAFKRGLWSTASEDYGLESIASIQFSTGLLGAKIALQGVGIDDTYPATKGLGRAFVTRAREQRHGRERGEEAGSEDDLVDTPTAVPSVDG